MFIFSLSSCLIIGNKINYRSTIRKGVWVEKDSASVHIVNYRNGMQHGRSYTIFSNNNYVIGRYKSDKKEGWFRGFDKAGNLLYKYRCKSDSVIQWVNYHEPDIF